MKTSPFTLRASTSAVALACAVALSASACGEGDAADDPTSLVQSALIPVPPAPYPLPIVAGGRRHTCAVFATGPAVQSLGKVRCWGTSDAGQLGYGNVTTIGDNEAPATAGNVNVGGAVSRIATGGTHTCALMMSTGAVRCWGFGGYGALGYGNQTSIGNNELPSSVGEVNVGGVAVQIEAGDDSTCVLLDTGNVRCWGSNHEPVSQDLNIYYGVGYSPGPVGDNEVPASRGDVSLGGAAVKQIAVGDKHICALLNVGRVRCWGYNSDGQLGYGNTEALGDNPGEMPPGNVSVGALVTQIAAGGAHTCALTSDGNVRCWGANHRGQLGYGHSRNIGDDELPSSAGDVNVGGPVAQLAAGGTHTCALLTNGTVRCWGWGDYGQLGYGNTNEIGNNETPASAGNVNVGGTVASISAGDRHSCAVLTSGGVRCWGYGDYGALGYGNTNEIGNNETPASAGNVPFQ
jgi:alpha-tubulin suppressor-like RCC1 family protein